MKNRLNKTSILVLAVILVGLSLTGLILLARLRFLDAQNSRNLAALEKVFPGFNNQSLEQLKREVKGLKARTAGLSAALDPKEKWFKKDYDLTIHFVEELGKINEFLRAKAAEKKTSFADITFKEKLPSEQEAFYLLSQLCGIKEVISLGMDYGITFKSVTPLGIEDLKSIGGIRIAKSNMELVCPAQNLIEFIIRLGDITPGPFIESVSLLSKDSVFEVNLTVSHVVMDLPWKGVEAFYPSALSVNDLLPPKNEESLKTLRNTSPFFIPVVLTSFPEAAPEAKAQVPPLPRFIFRGKARLKSKEVVVIEDTLKKKTVFWGKGDQIGPFLLKDFSEKEVVMQNMDDGNEMIIKQEEK